MCIWSRRKEIDMRTTLKTNVCFLVVICVSIFLSSMIVFGEEENLDYANEQLEVVDENIGYDDGSLHQDENVENEVDYSRAKVIKVLEESNKTNLNEDIESNTQLLEMLIIKGPHKGEKVNAKYELNYNFSNKYNSIPLKVGDEALLFIEENDAGEVETAYVAEIVRDK